MNLIRSWKQLALSLGLYAGGAFALPSTFAQEAKSTTSTTSPPTVAAEEPATTDREQGTSHSHAAEPLVKVGSDASLKAGDEAPQVVVVFGNAKIDGDVEQDLVVVGGDAELNGTVGNDAVIVFGSLKMGPKAKVHHNAVTVWGRLQKPDSATIGDQQVEVNLGRFLPNPRPVLSWFRHGLMLGRPLPPTIGWAWGLVGLFLLVYLVIALLLPRPVQACVQILEAKPVQSFLVGLLGFIAFGPLVFILITTVIGILIVPFLCCALVGAVWVGKTGAFKFMGLQVIRRLSPEANPRSLLALLVGAALVTMLYMVPILGFVVWGFLIPLGLGAAILATVQPFLKNGRAKASTPGGEPVMVAPVTPTPQPAATLQVAVPAETFAGGPSSGMPPLGTAPTAPADASPAAYVAMPRVGFWLRCAATFLDFLLLVWFMHAGPFWLVVWLAYHVGMWVWRGTTIGGIVCGIKVVRLDGRPVDFGVALVRGLASVLSAVVMGIGFFWAGWSAEKQSWHDKIAGTVIVKVPKGVSLI